MRLEGEGQTSGAATAGAFAPGERLGPFVIRQCIGQGGMGVVYRAEDDRMRREVALKVLRPDAAADPERERRLLREARAAGAVSHPNVAVIYEIGEASGRLFVAMELIEGKSLAERIEEGALPRNEAIGIALQILDGLACAHSVGIIHRDLKPANVMLGPHKTVKVLDFGIAARLWSGLGGDVTESTLTAAGRILGTPAYMAPEQARAQSVDQRADIFAFGVLLFEMLTGRRPFGGLNAADIMSAVLRDPPLSLTTLAPETPAAIAAVVERCLAKDPDARYGTCAEVRADIERALADAAFGTPPAGVAPLRSDTGPAAPPATAPSTRARAVVRWALGAALVGLATLIIVHLVSASGDDPRPAQTATDPAPKPGVAITDRPLPRSDKPEAITAYAAALNAFRDANWSRATAHLERAVALDHGLAAAHLRLAIVKGALFGGREARASYANAVEARATLDAHDREMLRALEPLVGVAVPDAAGAAERWQEVSAAFPEDAEITALSAFFANDSHRALEAARRATLLDPHYADAWQLQARSLIDMGRLAEAAEPLDRCTAISPMADDCRMDRAVVEGSQGRCGAMEEHLRILVARSSQTYPFVLSERANALFALGRPDGTVMEALGQLWAQYEPGERAERELTETALLDIARGRFSEAERKLLASGAALTADSLAEHRADRALLLASLYREMGRPDDAALVAEDYFSRRDAWVGIGSPNKEMMLLRLLGHTAPASEERFAARRAEVLARAGSVKARIRWSLEHLIGIGTTEEARTAHAARSQLSTDDVTVLESTQLSSFFMGRLDLLVGRPERAAATLRGATNGCWELNHAFLYNAARLDLGRALDETGDRAGACGAYREIITRWAHAEPRSVTAEEALARSTTLGCANL